LTSRGCAKIKKACDVAVEQINTTHVTVLLVEQNTEHGLAIAHKGFVLELGQVVLAGTGSELLSNTEVRKAYLGL
jgi:branched-chain amino acid transport system ATP-binding protein